jgi:hypothetical protein
MHGDLNWNRSDGPGIEGYLRFTISRLAVNAVFHYGRHDSTDEDKQANYAVYFEPWYIVRFAPSRIALFIGPRVGWTRTSVSATYAPHYNTHWDGVAVGGVGGILFQVVGPLAIQAQATFTASWYGEGEVATPSIHVGDGSATSIGLQCGVAFSVPWS